jgi:hypothetical protein
VAGGDFSLQAVAARGLAQRLGAGEGGQPAPDEQAVPAGAVLVGQQHGLALASVRAAVREAWISISATRPCTSASWGASSASMRPRRRASSHRAGRIQSLPWVAV